VARRGRHEGIGGPSVRAPDACPYRRPFPADFHDCPAYHPAYFVPLTSGYESMTPVWTCSHLVPGPVPGQALRFYGRCRLGDEAARLAWVETLHGRRLAELRRLSMEVARATATATSELVGAKGAQLQAEPDSPEREAATEALRDLQSRWLADFDAFLRLHGAELGALDFPPDAVRALCVELIDAWIAQGHSGPPEVPADALRSFPEDVRLLLNPEGESGGQ